MDLEERIEMLLLNWGYASVEEIANELSYSQKLVEKTLLSNAQFEREDNHGNWRNNPSWNEE